MLRHIWLVENLNYVVELRVSPSCAFVLQLWPVWAMRRRVCCSTWQLWPVRSPQSRIWIMTRDWRPLPNTIRWVYYHTVTHSILSLLKLRWYLVILKQNLNPEPTKKKIIHTFVSHKTVHSSCLLQKYGEIFNFCVCFCVVFRSFVCFNWVDSSCFWNLDKG